MRLDVVYLVSVRLRVSSKSRRALVIVEEWGGKKCDRTFLSQQEEIQSRSKRV